MQGLVVTSRDTSRLRRFFCLITVLGMCFSIPALALNTAPTITTDIKMGYAMNQNGFGWPSLWNAPLDNNNRNGFYMSLARIGLHYRPDSQSRAVLRFHATGGSHTDPYANIIDQAYYERLYKGWNIRLGWQPVLSPHQGIQVDDMDAETIVRTLIARNSVVHRRQFGYTDIGVMAERKWLDDKLQTQIMLRNGTLNDNVPYQPAGQIGAPIHALGWDFALIYQLSSQMRLTSFLGILGSGGYHDFFGSNDFWHPDRWLQQNQMNEGGLSVDYAQGKMRYRAEWTLLAVRHIGGIGANGKDEIKSWGQNLFAFYDWKPKHTSYAYMEYIDQTDGFTHNDNLLLLHLGHRFSPIQEDRSLQILAEYCRGYEETSTGSANVVANDQVVVELRKSF